MGPTHAERRPDPSAGTGRRRMLLAGVIAAVAAAAALAIPAWATHRFSDVPDDHTHAEGVRWASDHRLVNGHPDGSFRPDQPVTRGQLTTVLYRQGAWQGPVYTLTPDCGSRSMVVVDFNLVGSGAASVEYSVDGGTRTAVGAIPSDGSPLQFDANASGLVSLFVDGIAWAHAPTGETCVPRG